MIPLKDYISRFRSDSSKESSQSLAKNDSLKISVHPCRLGLGVFAIEDIAAGEYVAGFYGEIYSAGRASLLPMAVANHAIQFSAHVWRDSFGIARLFNHSCEPNCYIKGDFDIVTLRHIAAGEELTWDYSTTENCDWVVPGKTCLCRSNRCRGTIPPYRHLSHSEQVTIAPRTSDWLRSAGAVTSLQKKTPDRVPKSGLRLSGA